jgi:hypothetical protein
MARRGMAGGRQGSRVSVWMCCDGGGHIVAGGGEAGSLSLGVEMRSGDRRQTQTAAKTIVGARETSPGSVDRVEALANG